MQDDDLSLLDSVEFAYYAIYNCFRKYARDEDIDPWLIVNQALSSSGDEASWLPQLTQAIAAASSP